MERGVQTGRCQQQSKEHIVTFLAKMLDEHSALEIMSSSKHFGRSGWKSNSRHNLKGALSGSGERTGPEAENPPGSDEVEEDGNGAGAAGWSLVHGQTGDEILVMVIDVLAPPGLSGSDFIITSRLLQITVLFKLLIYYCKLLLDYWLITASLLRDHCKLVHYYFSITASIMLDSCIITT